MRRNAPLRTRSTRRLGPVAVVFLAILVVCSSRAVMAPSERTASRNLTSTTPTVYFSPNPVEVGWGLTRDVDIIGENLEGVYAVEIRVSFPNSLVQVVDSDPGVTGVQIRDGDIFSGFDTYLIQNSADNSTGIIEYIISITGSQVGMSGNAFIATIPFESLAIGSAVMSFIEVLLCERDGTSIPVEVGFGQAQIDVVTETSTPTPTPEEGASPSPTHTTAPGPTSTTIPATEVHVVPDTQQTAVGDTDVVQIEVRNVWDLYGFDARVDYNGALLDVEDGDPLTPEIEVYMGDVFNGFSYQILQNEVYDDGVFGQIHFVAYINAGLPLGFCGDGIMFWILFRGVSPGLTNITLAEVALFDHGGTTISRSLFHGEIEVVSYGPTNTTTMTLTPTSTPTVTTTPPTATPTGSPVPPTLVCGNRIENGDFEDVVGDEAPPWVRSGSTTYTTVERFSGLRSAWLGGYNDAEDGLCQEVYIPSPAQPGEELTQATLSYHWGMVTDETSHPFDFMWVRIRTTGGALLQELETISDGSVTGVWQYSQFDLMAYEGQTIQACFEAATNSTNPTSFWVDEVTLEVCELLQPTATPTSTPTPTISPTPTDTGLPTATPTTTPTPIVETFQYAEGVYENCYDSYLSSWDETENYGHQGALLIRTHGSKRPVLYFDVSSVPSGVTIMDARLWLYSTFYKSHPQDLTVSTYGLKRSWAEMETTWVRARSGIPWTLGGADDTSADRDGVPAGSELISDVNTWYGLDVTSLVQAWVDGTRENYGLLLLALGNTAEMSFWSSEYSIPAWRPKLIVQYAFGVVPTSTSTPEATETTGPSPTPTTTATPSGTEMVFQQGHLGYAGTEDTYISEWEPTTNYGGNVAMIIRQGDVRSSLVRFDLSALPPGVSIEEAWLELYSVNRTNEGDMTIDVHPVLRPWAEGQATWELATSVVPWTIPGCLAEGTDLGASVATQRVFTISDWHEWDVTGLVQGWYANPSTNQGVILRGSGTTSVEYLYATSEYWWALTFSPRLVVRYSTP